MMTVSFASQLEGMILQIPIEVSQLVQILLEKKDKRCSFVMVAALFPYFLERHHLILLLSFFLMLLLFLFFLFLLPPTTYV